MTQSPLAKGVHRAAFDIPIDTWNELVKLANATGQKPTSLVRQWIAERLETEATKRSRKERP